MTPEPPPTHHPHPHPLVVITLVEPNDILSRLPAAFISHPAPPPTSSGRRRPTRRGRQLLSGAKARGERGNEAARPALPPSLPPPPSGDRCDCLTRSVGGGVPIKRLGRPSRAPHGPSHLSGPPAFFFGSLLHPRPPIAADRRGPSLSGPRTASVPPMRWVFTSIRPCFRGL